MSLKKIAEMTGVSISTVSRVLNNKDYNCASAELKDKIWDAARSIHYVPNESARNLKLGQKPNDAKKSYLLSVVLERLPSLDDDPFFRELFRSVEQEVISSGCAVGEIYTPQNLSRQTKLSGDGFIILGRSTPETLERIKKVTKNIIAIDRNPTQFELDEVVCDGRQAAVLAMEYLIEKGDKKIAYIGDCSYENRYVGYCDTMIKNRLPMDYSMVVQTDQTARTGYEAMKKLLENRDVEAVFCANDATAAGALLALRKFAGKRKLDVISIDDIEIAQQTKPLLTTVHIPHEAMGKMAVKMLIDRIRKGHSENIRIEFPSRLVKRESC
ncbi:MAG: LacI family transcriptional regulator [Clostridiales bacterium]|nr:LacI family transcriptional regulator [Clostridiales bacterium]